jgi:hypothetical protein
MRWTILALPAIAVVLVCGCGSTISPDEEPGPDYPDIENFIAFYQFDGSLNNTVSDDLHVMSQKDPQYIADHNGADSSAIYVRSTSDTLWIPSRGAFDITGEITLAAWVQPELRDNAYCTIVDKDYDAAYSMGVGGATAPDTTALRLYVSDWHFWTSEAVPFGTGEWTHVACSYDESSGVAKFYVNGTLRDSLEYQIDIGISDEDLRIGRSAYGDDYEGGIDQVAVFDRALTPAEVAELYAFD